MLQAIAPEAESSHARALRPAQFAQDSCGGGRRGEDQQRAAEILREAERLRATVGKGPMGLAAAALYIACLENGEKHTQKMFAGAAGVTEVTTRNLYKELEKVLDMHKPEGVGKL